MKKQILIIDDDAKLGELLKSYLAQFDFSILIEHTPSAGISLLKHSPVDLIILDVMLPEMDGFETIKTIRKFNSVPVIMLTARGEITDRIVGLELGADDYLPKPFEPRELLARINTILRRVNTRNTDQPEILTADSLKLDTRQRTVKLNDIDIELTNMEFEILLLLMQNPSRVISRDDIMEEVRGIDWDAYNRSIDVTVSRIRAKLQDDAKHPRFIKTIWGKGYQFIEKVVNDAGY